MTYKNDNYCFGGNAFRAFAKDVGSGKFDSITLEQFNEWLMYTCYVCNLATNSRGCNGFLEKSMELNPDFTFLNEVIQQYRQTGHLWNDQNGQDLEAIGGGFNITLETLQDKEKRNIICAKLLEFAECMDQVVRILKDHI